MANHEAIIIPVRLCDASGLVVVKAIDNDLTTISPILLRPEGKKDASEDKHRTYRHGVKVDKITAAIAIFEHRNGCSDLTGESGHAASF